MLRLICAFLYYAFAQYLPSSYIKGFEWCGTIRYFLCRNLFKFCGEGARIEPNAFFNSGRNVELGENSSIGENNKIRGSVRIGKNVMIGEDVLIISQSHKFDRTDFPMNQQGFEEDVPVTIDDDVWIGSRAIILPGVHIQQGSIVGAGSVVTKSVEPYSIVGGNPARLIRQRK